jgi:hypothetical protein
MSIASKVQRTWNGKKRYKGTLFLKYNSGEIATSIYADGKEVGTVEGWGGDDELSRYWHTDGRQLEWDEWFMFMSLDYVPRQMGGTPAGTEVEWRKAVEGLRSKGIK